MRIVFEFIMIGVACFGAGVFIGVAIYEDVLTIKKEKP